jgi:quercetin dioxygenase-like cupin family protein
MNSLPDFLPALLRENMQGMLAGSEIRFEPMQAGARSQSEICWLFRPEEANGSGAALIRYQPGGSAPCHLHTSFELIYMLEGEMITTQGTVRKNDLILLPPGSQHASRSETGCLALIVWNQPVQIINRESLL